MRGFGKNTASAVKVAALNYLGEFGVTSDLSRIRNEFDKNDNKTSSAAADALIRINLRESRDNGQQDIALVRRALKSGFVDYSAADVEVPSEIR